MTAATTWKLDPAHTHVEFAVRHLMIATVKGKFTEVQGSVTLTGNDPATASVEVNLAAASLTTGIAPRDDHLRSPDFLEVDRFPAITFRSRAIEKASEGEYRVVGDLTIRDVTREVTLAVTSEGAVRDPWGGYRAGYTATARIKRSDFGITWNQLIEAGGVAVGDEVRISVETELVQEAVPQAA
ncbi:MAG: YceI family protein [Gemmatimonadales bacterium]